MSISCNVGNLTMEEIIKKFEEVEIIFNNVLGIEDNYIEFADDIKADRLSDVTWESISEITDEDVCAEINYSFVLRGNGEAEFVFHHYTVFSEEDSFQVDIHHDDRPYNNLRNAIIQNLLSLGMYW